MDGRILAAVILGGILGSAVTWMRIRGKLTAEEWSWLKSFYIALLEGEYRVTRNETEDGGWDAGRDGRAGESGGGR